MSSQTQEIPVTTQPPVTQPPVTQPPVTQPLDTEPPVTEPELPNDGSTNPGDSDETSTHTGNSDCECPEYPDCPEPEEPEKCHPTFVPITLEIAPVIDLLVNKPKVCLKNKAVCKPCYFSKNGC